jgi:hypothetical protein
MSLKIQGGLYVKNRFVFVNGQLWIKLYDYRPSAD